MLLASDCDLCSSKDWVTSGQLMWVDLTGAKGITGVPFGLAVRIKGVGLNVRAGGL